MKLLAMLLLLVPVLFSVFFLIARKDKHYKVISICLSAVLSTLAIIIAFKGPASVEISGGLYTAIEAIILLSEVIILVFLYYVSIKHKRWGTLIFTVVQTALTLYTLLAVEGGKLFESGAVAYINIDKLSIVMLLIINVIGTLIVIFSNGYLTEYEHHRHMKSRQKFYYIVISLFLGAMNGIVISDSLSWIYFFWELTTLASFLLISYNKDKEAYNSGFRALFLNLIGGVAFGLAIILFEEIFNISTLTGIIQNGRAAGILIIPVLLLAIAGFTKSAQVPFQSWLLGAMVAPTPVSALLHSSTMVKAGVYLIVKLSPAYAGTNLGIMIAVFGGFTFLICSVIAFTQRNAKRILAYSTIANLGLIIATAGMGTSIAISAAIMLIIFHAITKALLFLCAGEIEHAIGSRDIEDMTGLINKAPVLTIYAAIGMLSFLTPPFGVLITKWISIEAVASNPIVAIFLVLGSAFTAVFWIKWLATIMAYPTNDLRPKRKLEFFTFFPVTALVAMIIGASVAITVIFNNLVSPEVQTLLQSGNDLLGKNGKVYSKIGTFNDAAVFLVVFGLILVVYIIRKKLFSPKIKKVYLCGENSSDDPVSVEFRWGWGEKEKASVSNLYLDKVIDENKLTKAGYLISILIIIAAFIGGLV